MTINYRLQADMKQDETKADITDNQRRTLAGIRNPHIKLDVYHGMVLEQYDRFEDMDDDRRN